MLLTLLDGLSHNKELRWQQSRNDFDTFLTATNLDQLAIGYAERLFVAQSKEVNKLNSKSENLCHCHA